MQGPAVREAFDGRDLAAFGAERREQAAVHGLAVDEHAAGAAVAGVAAFFHAEPSELTQEGAQALARARRRGGIGAVDEIGHGSPASSLRISSAKSSVMCRRQAGRAVQVVEILTRADGLLDALPQRRARRQRRKGESHRPRRRCGDGERKAAIARERPDQEGGGTAERRERNLAEGGALHERRGGQRNRTQQFAGPQHAALGTEHEVGDGDAPLPAVGRPDGADAVECRGERDHRASR